MYKSKLQELCQKRKWAPPKYTCMRDGPDHCPQFKASVVVSRLNFDTPTVCKNSKEAYNEAAKVAFLHLCPEASNKEKANIQKEVQSPPVHTQDVHVKHEAPNHTNEHVEQRNEQAKVQKEVQSPPVHAQDMNIKQDVPEEFKKKLRIYVQTKKLDLPVYHSEKEAPSAPYFRGRVSIGEDWFHSEELYNTVEEADDAAAQEALLSLTTDALYEEDSKSYKNLLQELAEEEGLLLPKYTTIGRGEQAFSCTVEIEGEVFEGFSAKSKKQAELNAAKTAYTVFMEHKLFQPGYFSARNSNDNICKLAPRLDSLTISEDHGNLSSSIKGEQTNGEHEEIANDHTDNKPGVAKCTTTDACLLSSSEDSTIKTPAEEKYYLLGNRFKVYTCIPDIALPKGTVVLQISENKWTMVGLEFPNEKCMSKP